MSTSAALAQESISVIDPVSGPPPQIDTTQVMDWLTLAAWGSAAASILGVLAGLVMLAFGSRQGPRMIVGGVLGTVVGIVVATSVLPHLPGLAS
ncbi:hypothetical protein HQ346_16910 [Rhodococcus sp. BP-252]|uniref:hypothetical protein n=1 Tax=unclassified Rhodococcus (in: high G+C Gram-positive bacteria) TaxID=192944 RepID=UPI001C9B56B5|nr:MULTISPECIES: hypothetical protein [unclassified Rhodococcus (in: high G+C Gram-positive bacteria)]MBY6413377.1 hypothetical protein [Rhodococcus sp. BP-320]MBY6418019.1 hypothetical protein [Rhodococcus sp. BP-321]MBY6422291.1 hypothetical protein [Rhodococcus sp. BP-324]MBY6428068.1 hypothetical protein [Rhodococcus sp. BP-323]MBY6433298.1 hypothetical protein [Rhodococcus sp. BP-322]